MCHERYLKRLSSLKITQLVMISVLRIRIDMFVDCDNSFSPSPPSDSGMDDMLRETQSGVVVHGQ